MKSDKASQITDRKNSSLTWLNQNYHDEWVEVFKHYKCERDPEKDENGKDDLTQSSIGMPDTWSHVRRLVARGTAQPPNVRFRANDPNIQKLVSRTIMYQWDKARVQKQQKRHFTQAALFGWSVRAWWWDYQSFQRSRRIDPMDPELDQTTLQAIADRYRVPIGMLTDPELGPAVRSGLLATHGRGGMLPISYKYVAYEGPACDFIFIGDCYPQPNFQTIQASSWFIVERRRNLNYFEGLMRLYPQLEKGVKELIDRVPYGNRQLGTGNTDSTKLRERMLAAIDHSSDDAVYANQDKDSGLDWTITEMYTPGPNGKVSFCAGESGDEVFIGEIPLPYDLDGKIPFTELRLIDDLLCGIGDSTARIMRGLQSMHDRLANRKSDLVDSIARPFWATDDRALYEQPGLVKKLGGFRLLHLRNAMSLRQIGEPASQASVVASLNEENAVSRAIQMATGDSNLSMNANVDPQQNRTATGARIGAYNQDILTKDIVDMWTQATNDDAEMMYMLNRSELSEPLTFDANQYDRQYESDRDLLKEEFMTAEPRHFQVDGEILVEAGSTLADDDDANVQRAEKVYMASRQDPGINQDKAREDFLIAQGKGRELAKYKAPPPPPPPPPEKKINGSVSIKLEALPPPMQLQILNDFGLEVQPPPPPVPPPPMGPPPPPEMAGPPPGGPPMQMPPPPPEEQLIAAQAAEAARGHSPFQQGHQ